MQFLRITVFILALAVSPALAAEDPIVNDGLTITSHLTTGVDNTNIIYSENVTGTFTTSNGSPTVTVKHTLGLTPAPPVPIVGTKFSLTGTSATVGGLTMDGAWVVASIVDTTHFTFTHSSNATSTVSTPAANTTITYSTFQDDGKLRFLCNYSHLLYDDPIKNPGQPGAAHLHLFFGNTLTDANSTYATLRANGNGTCDGGPLNRTAYWMPAMIDSSLSKVRIPLYFEWYYTTDTRQQLIDFTSPNCVSQGGSGLLGDGRTMACPQLALKKIERGQKAIFGFNPSTGAYPPTYQGPDANTLATAWSCLDTNGNDVSGGYRYLYHRSSPSLGLVSDPANGCPSSGQIRVRAVNPNCWDGTHDNATDHFSHFAPDGDDLNSNKVCPATHPHRFLRFTVIAVWTYTGGISTASSWYLDSDRHNGANFEAGETYHWDMFWAWNDTIQEYFHEHINGMSPSSATGAPYLLNSAGQSYVGGPWMRNTNNGGLGSDCTALVGSATPCTLKDHTTYGIGISDILMDIPALRRRGFGRMK